MASPESVHVGGRASLSLRRAGPAADLIDEIYDLYDEVAEAQGYTTTPEHRGYAIRVSVADTDEKAYEEGRHFFWQLGTSFGVAPRHWLAPPGYISREAYQGRREHSAHGRPTSRPVAPSSATTRPTRRTRSSPATPTR